MLVQMMISGYDFLKSQVLSWIYQCYKLEQQKSVSTGRKQKHRSHVIY